MSSNESAIDESGSPSGNPAGPRAADNPRQRFWQRHEGVRRQAAKAIHNELGQGISAIKMTAHLLMGEEDAELRQQDLEAISATADSLVERLRELQALLYPPQLDSIGLPAALQALLARQGATCELALEHDAQPRDALAELACYRALEALLAWRHDTGLGSGLRVRLGTDADCLRLYCEQALAVATSSTDESAGTLQDYLAPVVDCVDGRLAVAWQEHNRSLAVSMYFPLTVSRR